MYLIKCHIYNFGKFTDFEYEFNKGLNVINKDNGWGKTTLSVFIKSIFYGLNKTRVTDLENNDRKAYDPFGGGKYGGYIDFCYDDGKIYRLERVFDSTSTLDNVVLTDLSNGNRFSEKENSSFGERLFGVNANVFLRTLFLSQKELDLSDNSSISDCIGNVYQDAKEDDIAKAIKTLDDKRKVLSSKKGPIVAKELEIEALKQDLDKVRIAIRSTAEIELDIDKISKNIDVSQEKYNKLKILANKVRDVGAITERKAQFDEKTAKINEIERFTSEVNQVFKDVPAEEDLVNDVQRKYYYVKTLDGSIKNLDSQIVKQNEQKTAILSKYKVCPTTLIIDEYKSKLNEISSIENNNNVQKNVNDNCAKKLSKKPALLFGFASLLLLITSVLLLSFNITYPAYVGFGFTVIFVFITAFNFIRYFNKKDIFNSLNGCNLSNNYDLAHTERLKTELLLLKDKLGVSNLTDKEALEVISYDVNTLKEIEFSINNKQNDLDKDKEDLSKTYLEVQSFVNGLDLSYFDLKSITDLGDLFDKLKFLLNQKTIVLKDVVNLSKEVEILQKAGIVVPNDLQNVNIDDIEKQLTQLEDTLINDRDLLTNRKNYLENSLNAQEKFNELSDALDKAKEDLLELKNQLNLINKTKEFIESSRNSLTERYLEPIKTGIQKYVKLFTNMDVKDMLVDTKYEISLANKPIGYQSKGWRNIFALALRFAFIDEVFSNSRKTPFVVLDDPFVNLDDEKLYLSLQAVNDYAKDKQVIYFTCHNSRTPY